MRKYFLSLVAMATMILFSGCNKNEDFYISENGDMVTFNIATPEMGTRAISDGTTVSKLYVAVYQGGVFRPALTETDGYDIDNKTATVSLPLVTGVTYDIVFWAQAEGAPYTFNAAEGIVSVDYTDVTANNENLDAFYANRLGYEVKGPKTETIELTRPFAQLNVATLDYELAKNSGIEITETAIEVEGVYTSFNLKTQNGAIDANSATTITLSRYATPKEQSQVLSGHETYSWLSMNYLLVNDKTNIRAKMTTNNDKVTREWHNIPVQRNYRTNILGNILTTTTDFNVVIEEEWNNPDFVEEYVAPGIIFENNQYEITSEEGILSLAELVNSGENNFEDQTITLASDIDLSSLPTTRAVVSNWISIGTEANPFTGTFDGNGKTIKNLNIVESEAKEGKAYIGFFGYVKDATIKNVTFENVNIYIPCLDIDHSQGHIGAVAGSIEGTSTIENVTVKGDIKVEATVTANGASRVAVVAGGNEGGDDVTMKNVHVIAKEGSYLKANNNVGALAGQLQGRSVFENCSSNIDVTGTKFFAGGIIGLAAGDQLFTNCHTTGDIKITAGRAGRAHDQYRVGGIAGGWADGATKVCTLDNCSYEGEISGKNSDGSEAIPLDYMGYVGRGYTLNGCQGSKVIIDGVEYVQAFNTAAEAGIYYVNGVWTINSATELKILADKVNGGIDYFEGKTIKLGAEIDLKNEEWIPIGSATKDHGFMGNFDGNDNTIKNLKITKLTPDTDNYVYAGLFGVTEGTDAENQNYIKNLVIENVTIETTGHIAAAAIAYPYYTQVEKITVKGNISIKGGDYTSGILAYTRRCIDAKNLTIQGNEGSIITGNHTVGGVISDIQMNGGLTANYENFSAEGLRIEASMHVGGISGIIAGQTLDGAEVENVNIVCNDARRGIVSGSLGQTSTIINVYYDNVGGANSIIGASYKDNGPIFEVDGVWYKLDIGTIVNINGIKGIIYSYSENSINVVSVAELNLNGKNWGNAMTWAEDLGQGWELASIYELDEIHKVRFTLNDALEKDSKGNVLFEEDEYSSDGKYALYLSSTEATGNDPQGEAYFSNRVFLKYFNLNGYWDYPLSTFATISKSAPLKDNYFARGVYTIAR